MKQKKKKIISPIAFFFLLIIGTILVSAIIHYLGEKQFNNKYLFSWLSQASYNTVNSVTGELESQVIEVQSLLNREGAQYIISNSVSNFVTFAPLGMILISLIGLSVAEKSGFLKSLSLFSNKNFPDFFLTMLIIFLGIVSTIFVDLGYVVLIPLAALLFTYKKRNPLGGIIAAFAGISGGYGVNVLVGSLDVSLITYTKSAVNIKLLQSNALYNPSIYSNYFFMIVAVILITIVATIITEKLIMK